MIVTDLDGTLLRSDETISDYTLDVLGRCRLAGHKIAFATARSTRSAARFLERFAPDVLISYGGALAVSGGEVICRFAISPEISDAIIRECLAEPKITSVRAINEVISLSSNPEMGKSYYRQVDFSKETGHSYLKITITASDFAAVKMIANRFPMCDLMGYTGEDMYRFADKNAVKWSAVRAVAEHFSCDVKELIAFGNDINDLEMLKNCGMGVAVENAVGEVKSAAGCICPSNDNDGVAKWLEENLLEEARKSFSDI